MDRGSAGGMAQLAAETVRKSRSGLKKTRSKPPKTRSTIRFFGKAMGSDGEGLNGGGLSGDKLRDGLDGGCRLDKMLAHNYFLLLLQHANIEAVVVAKVQSPVAKIE
ncbi:hypothetical protein FH972_020482 [Carpinus fangiana]|uniref:Uncharacterized protein n=1 Tax=Carpinus fangiana TaxID=176857 RepID=A0A5N6RUW5_9ROSI|nr:hypothetical protein FH972_020482 [Carpinus fangiana]